MKPKTSTPKFWITHARHRSVLSVLCGFFKARQLSSAFAAGSAIGYLLSSSLQSSGEFPSEVSFLCASG